jgi:hypothetical protein
MRIFLPQRESGTLDFHQRKGDSRSLRGRFLDVGRMYRRPSVACSVENVVFIDPFDGRAARGLELERIYQKMMDIPTGETSGSEESA